MKLNPFEINHKVCVVLVLLCWTIANSMLNPRLYHHRASSICRTLASSYSSWIAQGMWLSIVECTPDSQPLSMTMHHLKKVVSMDPANRFYRTNAAGILAYDTVAQPETPPAEAKRSIRMALDLLEEGIQISPRDSAYYYYEIGKIHLLKLEDPTLARTYFKLAAEY